MMQFAKIMIIFLGTWLLSACKGGDGAGTIHGPVSIESCSLETDDFNLRVDFFAASYTENTLTIRLQRTGDLQTFTDGLYIEVRDVSYVRARLGEPLTIALEPSIETFRAEGPQGIGSNAGVPLTPYESPVRATLYLNETCPDNRLAFTDGEGTITFDSIYAPPNDDKRISGSFSFEFIDPRTWDNGEIADSASMTGEFRFTHDRNPQEQPFL
jgi:hypothetical protein